MRFTISHVTHYRYETAATESFMEARVCPPSNRAQTVSARALRITPECRVTSYTDCYGNLVEQFAIVHPHDELLLHAESEVATHPPPVLTEALDITISEARQIYRSQPLRWFDFLNASPGIAPGRTVHRLAHRLFSPTGQLGDEVHRLMGWIHSHLRYTPGATAIDTPVEQVIAARHGVCQDFAHAMIAVLRAAALPARYVCGYIETEHQRRAAKEPERQLVGAAESHAWVEVALPNGEWYALDPTNNIPAGTRHVVVAVGRDFHDTSPTRGVFKGAGATQLEVRVLMQRVED